MPDNGRFSDREIEHDLRDLGARIEYPPTPDLAQAVRRQIDDEDTGQQARRFWPTFLSPRWAVPAAALVLIAVALFSPAVRGTLSDLFVASNSGQQAGAGGSAARPESGGSGARSGKEAGVASQTASSSTASRAQPSSGETSDESTMAAGATGCPSPSLETEPAKAAPGAVFQLRGHGFSSGCDEIKPPHHIRIDFRQDGNVWKLATVDADRGLTFDARLRVPAGARSGQATVRATIRSGELVKKRFFVLR